MAPNSIKGTMASNAKSLEDAFINVLFEEVQTGAVDSETSADPAYGPWIENASAKRAGTEVWSVAMLKKMYPKHSIVVSTSPAVNLLAFPMAFAQPMSPDELIVNTLFVPLARRIARVPGMLAQQVQFGAFNLTWKTYEFILYVARWPAAFSFVTEQFILFEGPEDLARELILSAGIWFGELHGEILVFNQGFWRPNAALWQEVQKADWKDIIMKQEFKDALQKDIYGFFESEEIYKELAIPWKRGLIMYGPPGNGKTITIKAVMKACDDQGFAPLYVKSFQSYKGEEGAMEDVFTKARQMSPCVLIFEDLDTLITDRNRSFFLNQLDGLEDNSGMLCIGSTNHFERLDPALSTRPSRFDRKYNFEDPDQEERSLYAKYWQNKLSSNKSISFPDSLVDEVATMTDKFSFAYLKEAFVSTLVVLATQDKEPKEEFAPLLRKTIKSLRKQLDKPSLNKSKSSSAGQVPLVGPETVPPRSPMRDLHSMALAATALGRSYI